MTSKENKIATVIQVFGIILIVVCAFRAMAIADGFNGGIVFDVFLQGLIYGILLIGFGEVIKLIQGLFNQREPFRPVEPVADGEDARRAALAKTGERTVSLESRSRIMDHYAKLNLIVDDIEATPYDGYSIVHHDGNQDVVDLNNFEAEILTENQLRSQPELRALIE